MQGLIKTFNEHELYSQLEPSYVIDMALLVEAVLSIRMYVSVGIYQQ